MKKLTAFLFTSFLFIVLPLAASAQYTTVSANVYDITGNAQTGTASSYQLCFTLIDAAGYPPVGARRIGTGIFPALHTCLKPNGSGAVSTQILGNDQITIGATTGSGTQYRVDVEQAGTEVWSNNYIFSSTGGPYDLSTAAPNTTTPAVPAPQGDATYLRLDGGVAATGAIQAPSLDIAAPIYADRQAGSDMCAKIVAAMRAFPNGGWIQLPQGKFVCTTQLLVPNDGASPPTQPSYRISGVASGGTVQFFPDNGCHGGTILDMQFSASTGKIDSRGLGKLEIDHICFMDSATDFTPFVFDTLTVLQFHHNQIIGNSGHFPAGCCASAPPTQDGQTGIILGGTGTTADGTTTSIFQGYGTSIDHNQFDYCGQCVLLQNATNSVNIESNHFFNHITNTTHGPITVNPTQTGSLGSQRTAITNNLIEVGASKYGIHLVANAQGDYIAGNACWDANIGVITVDCVKEESAAGNTNNHIINPQQDSNTGNLPDSITSSSSRVQNGRFLGAVGATGAGDCTKPIFGASHIDGFGMSINGGAEIFCGSSLIQEIFNNAFGGEITVGSGGVLDWQHTANPVIATPADTMVSSPAAGVVSIDTSAAGNAAGKLRLAQIQSVGGTATMGVTLKKGSNGGDYTTTSTTYTQVDGTNLAFTTTIPVGWKLSIVSTGDLTCNTSTISPSVAIADGGTVVLENFVACNNINTFLPWNLAWVVNGDGASHSIDLRYKTTNAADSAQIANHGTTIIPTMVFTLMPSN